MEKYLKHINLMFFKTIFFKFSQKQKLLHFRTLSLKYNNLIQT